MHIKRAEPQPRLARLTFQHNLISGIRQARAILWNKDADPPILVLLRVVALATMAAPIAMVAFAGGSGRLLRANQSLVPPSFDSHQLVVAHRLSTIKVRCRIELFATCICTSFTQLLSLWSRMRT